MEENVMQPSYPHAAVHPNARIGKNVKIGPWVTIEADVVIGDDTTIGANVCIMSGTRIGKNCQIFPGAIVGAIPQDLKYSGEDTTLEIGDNVIIREYCTLNRGTRANYKTVIGNNCLLMAYVHVAHDCVIGEHCILANNATLAGHVEIEEHVILGGMTAVHQFVQIGAHALIGGGTLLNKDVPPYVRISRYPASYIGVNTVGLRRQGFASNAIRNIQDIYHQLFVEHRNISKGIKFIEEHIEDSQERQRIIGFTRASKNGLIKGLSNKRKNDSPQL
ncbi:acyl-ACP--UDP-N-acetylglucosamine O-acyltransferase [Aureispira anguillae]|uniref:Acyl-ACP--UDP-N-acetylglucosamine O-acyltransferase n=1 Tax=Aureispira anguillae TaxID=2864201 RepID=A0A916DUT1_9BACT|nr:acyl-ACP--UDP-N-acetylglucosamine O-acyltransferase [Aureispira anguillae]BDS12506.1 acyl-ACP--UDP-N-acetylglucosamine O-acyltransferase [Aureispira anguillae]